jgi:hypothetical protein
MSSALTGNKIKDSYQALLKMGTNGSLDPVTAIAISDGLGNDTPLLLSGIEFKTQVVSAAKPYGFWADLSSNSHVAVGDYAGQYNGTYLYVSDINKVIQANNGGSIKGLNLDFFNNNYRFGEINGNTAFLNIDINYSSLFGNEAAYLESSNKQVIGNNGLNQLIYTYNDNGTYSGDRGFKLDFSTNVYTFGDPNGIAYNGSLAIGNGASELFSEDNYLALYGPSLNTWLGYYQGSIYNFDVNANSNNYVFGSDWLMDNDDDAEYPFKYNTVLNCYNNNLDTSDIAISYSLFANIQDPHFDLFHGISLLNDISVSNCFIFGLNDFIGSSTLKIFETFGIPTNVVVINGSNLTFQQLTSSIFSVNASSINFASDTNSGINIIGGDFAFKDNLYPADHILPVKGNYGITIQGRKAYSRNDFSYVKAEYFEDWGTQQGQVQVEELQLFNHWNDGSVTQYLLDTIGNAEMFVQNSSTYTVEVKLISTIGNGDRNDTGNSYINKTWKVCVDSSGNITISDPCNGCNDNPGGATAFDIQIASTNKIRIAVAPDSDNSNECWVKAYVTLSCVTIN